MATETMEQAVTEAVRILREGGVILYPTDTVWGIGYKFDPDAAR